LKKGFAGPTQKSARGLGAARGAKTSSFEDIGKQIAMASAIAQGEGAKDEDKDFRKGVLEALNGLPDVEALKTMISKAITDALVDLPAAIARAITGKNKTFDDTTGKINKGLDDIIKDLGKGGALK
jgi:hypothetical protein